jgi:hypothetical protein
MSGASAVASAVRRLYAGYTREYLPLGGYATIVGAFHAGFAAFLALARVRRRPLPERPRLSDIALLGVASHKLGRLIARDVVTTFLRAPFTEFKGWGDLPNEVEEQARGRGLRRALGELLICPPCVDTWVASFLVYGLVMAPRATRLVATIFTALTVADFLQVAYLAAQARQEPAQPGAVPRPQELPAPPDHAPPAQQPRGAAGTARDAAGGGPAPPVAPAERAAGSPP